MMIRPTNRRLFGTIVALSLSHVLLGATAVAAADYLGSARHFAVLGASTVTNTGSTTIYGDLGVSPGIAITGLGSITLTGAVEAATAAALAAHNDIILGAATLAALPFVTDLTGQDLGSVGVLSPGVYRFASSAQLTGTLTLDYGANSNVPFVFQIGSSLITASGANVVVLGGGNGSGLFWNVGSAATLGTGTQFAGNIIAGTAITLDTGASILCGRALALTAAVTMNGNQISSNCAGAGSLSSGRTDYGSGGFAGVGTVGDAVPEPAQWAMLVIGFGGVGTVLRRNRRQRASMVTVPG